ncbi:appr-1-p processing enzyme family protein [Mycena olivaceomarginata]|nr:appr-1-p processing enzyme family protein [Mycena olivaceomarginata]
MTVLSLAEYRSLIDLSPPPGLPDQTAASQDNVDDAYRIALDYLDPEDALSHLDDDAAVHALLTVRHADEGPLPSNVLQAVDTILAAKLTGSTLTPVDSIPALTSLFPSPSTALPSSFSRISFYRGDITRISSPGLAIANACNSALLGCFKPSHMCVDNVIHSAAGPRLRADCYTIMEAQGNLEPDGCAKVTKAWSLPSGYVIHTVGPRLGRGASPSEEEEEALSRCYTSCLDVADELGTVDAVAFPCISTGLFAFPGDTAARLALQAVDKWLAVHPNTNMRVIFTLFLPADVAHYTQALPLVFPSVAAETPKKFRPLIPPEVIERIKNADAIMIRAGAGMSVDAVHKELGLGLDYTSPTVFSTLYPGLVKSSNMRCLYDTFGNDFPDENTACAFRLLHPHTILSWGQTPVYEALHKLVHTVAPTDHFIVTSNADRLFYQSGFDPARIYTPQGTYALLQCMQPCAPDAYFPIQPFIDRALPHLDRATMRFPNDALFEELRPRCPRCGSADVFLNVRAADWFLETPQAAARAAYEAFVARCAADGRRLVLLELGCGFNTPSVIRWPGERMAAEGEGNVTLVRVNGGARHAAVPAELVRQGTGFGMNMGAMEFLEALEDAGVYRSQDT